MALPSTVYRASIRLADVDRERYEELRSTVARHPSETEERLVLRLLAYALFQEEGLIFTKGICAGDEPDLWIKAPDGRIDLWVEVGLPDAERLVKASRHAQRVALLVAGSGFPRWESVHWPRLGRIRNLSACHVDQGFVQKVASCLERSVDWSLTISGGILYLTLPDTTFETPFVTLS